MTVNGVLQINKTKQICECLQISIWKCINWAKEITTHSVGKRAEAVLLYILEQTCIGLCCKLIVYISASVLFTSLPLTKITRRGEQLGDG